MQSKLLIGFCLVALLMSPEVGAQSQQQLFEQNLDKVHDVPINPPADLAGTDLAWYAWRLFAGVNQGTSATLANGTTREVPSSTFLSTGRTGPLPNPVVFESYYHRTEAYPNFTGTTAPSPIGTVPTYRFAEGFTVPSPQGQYVNLDETNQIGQNFIFYRKSGNPMFPILFMAKVNSLEVNYAQQQANRNNQPGPSNSWVFPPNTLEVKSAWRPVADITNSDPNSYHQATATWYEGLEGKTLKVKTGTFALIGLHIIQKSDNYESFIYTTFEHVDAATREGGKITDPAYELTYKLLKYDGPTGTNPIARATGAYSVNQPDQVPLPNTVVSNALPPGNPANGSPAPDASHPPGSITKGTYIDPAGEIDQGKFKTAFQPQTITREVNDVNDAVYNLLKAKGGVWQNYRLKGAQATPTNDETAPDFYLANIVVETSQPGVQLFRGGVALAKDLKTFTNDRSQGNISVNLEEGKPVPPPTFNMGGCMGCHGVAQTTLGTDFSFLPPGAGSSTVSLSDGLAVDAVPPGDVTLEQLDAHRSAIQRRKSAAFYITPKPKAN